jgi:very-short-patch-repair endonuclease
MTEPEREIIQFLKLNPETFFNRKEISRKARRRSEYEEDPHWAAAPLSSLVAQKFVEQNDSGHYRLSQNYERLPGSM